MAAKQARHVVLTGVPGVGKTTLIRKTCEELKRNQIQLQGFITEEVRQKGRRTGFDVVTLSGVRGPLARVKDDQGSSMPGQSQRREFRVGQYVVDVVAFEQLALPILKGKKDLASSNVCVIDEIGKMELGSKHFPMAVRNLLDDPRSVVLATIPVPKGRPLDLVEHIRGRPDVTIFTVTRENRNDILNDITQAVMKSVQ